MMKSQGRSKRMEVSHGTPEAAVEQLGLPSQVSYGQLIKAVEVEHGKPIVVRAVPRSTLPGVSGLWLETESKSHILVHQDHSDLHKMHVVCHELGHILLRHEGCDGMALPAPSIFNHLGRHRGIKRMLARSPQWNDVEKAAEEVAYMLSGMVLEKEVVSVSQFERVFG